ncbi:unnamed protein product [Caenorhabditis brenneri]
MPKCVIAISGKRKSGKDYCTRIIKESLSRKNINVAIVGISNSLKEQYAKLHGLDFAELLTDGPYKEQFRKDMIRWGEDARKNDSGLFCRASIDPVVNTDIVIVSDCRRSTDYEFFTMNYTTLTVRIETSEENRAQRGFEFVEGVDDAESECGLDGYNFDFVLKNLTGGNLMKQLDLFFDKLFSTISKN